MDFLLSEEQEMLKGAIGEFVMAELDPIVDELEREHRFPLDVFRKLGELGYLGAAIPEEYGGSGLDLTSYMILVEELARVSPAFAMDVMVHAGAIAYGGIYLQGTEEQRRAFLPRMCAGDAIGAI